MTYTNTITPIGNDPNVFAAFSPYGTVVIAATAASGHASFTSALAMSANNVMVSNQTTGTVFVAFGSSSLGTTAAAAPTGTESSNSTPVLAGAIMVLTKGAENDTVAVIAPSANGSVYFTAGEGQ